MDGIILLVLTFNAFFSALCAYCLCVALTRNSQPNDEQTHYLRVVHVILKHFIRIGGFAFIAYLVFLAVVLSPSP